MSGIVADPLAEVAIRVGHRELLATFHEFVADDGVSLTAEGGHGMRAALGFLRHTLLPFAAWEEQVRNPSDPAAEDTAFEHAFLAAEIDAFARTIDELAPGRSPRAGVAPLPAGAAAERLRRHLHRIEAVLELHVQKAEDRQVLAEFASGLGDPGGGSRRRASGARAMGEGEIAEFLSAQEWGVLGTAGADGPYGVPIAFGYGDGETYIATGPGRKLQNLTECAAVCLTVVEVRDAGGWNSVVIRGEAVSVSGLRERARALAALARRRARGRGPTAEDLRRLSGARVFRIEAREVTGRSCD